MVRIVSLALLLAAARGMPAGQAAESASPVASPGSLENETPEQYQARMKWWREAKFGWFICWGPCSILAAEIGWSRNGPRPGIGPAPGYGVPMDLYDELYKQFNPVHFDAREWARLIRESGARYVIFLTKHHDGFCMFDSALTDYKITNTPFGRDVTRELAEALHEAGIKIFWYYSQPDWHHPDYRTANHARYVEYLHGQVRELLTKYGRVDGMWFDGLGGTAEDWDTPRLFRMCHELQPGIIINDRAGVPGDFSTPEQQIGHFEIARPWESCMTMSSGWSWTGAMAPILSARDCIRLLVRCAGAGGNLALDTGPLPDGRIYPPHADNYRAMGEWLGKYGESIYATTGGPYKPTAQFVSTRRGSTVYLHVLAWKGDSLKLPALGRRIVGCKALTGGTAMVRQTEEGLEIEMPVADRDDTDTIIALELDGPAEDIKPISTVAHGSLTVGKPASASSTWSPDYSAEMACDGDEQTRWGAAPGSTSGWLEIDLGAITSFDRILILEAPWNRVRRFQLQVRNGKDEPWQTFHEGTTMGDLSLQFPAVKARYFRLNILEAIDVPTIWEIYLYLPEGAANR